MNKIITPLTFTSSKLDKLQGFIIFTFLMISFVTVGQTTITSGNTVNASTITAGNTVTINAGGTLNMDVARSFASITTANSGTSTISGSNTLTVTGAVTIAGGNTLSLGTTCNSATVATPSLNNTTATLSGSGTLTATGALTINGTNNNPTTFSISSTATLAVGSIAVGNGNVNTTYVLTVNGILKNKGATGALDTYTCSATSTVEYNGTSAQTIFDVASPGYGNLTLTGNATKTAGGALDIQGDLTINTTATFAAGTSLTHNIQGDWTNNGTFSFTTGSVINFNGNNALQTISGTSTTTFGNLTVTKTSQSNILEATGVIALSGATNPLSIVSGTFKLSSASTIAPFTTGAGATIPTAGGFWNNGGTISGGGYSWTNNGLFRNSTGTTTIGTSTGNSFTNSSSGTFEMLGGTFNVAGRITNSGTATISGGTMNISTVASGSTTSASFESTATSNLTMTSGSPLITFQNANTSAPSSGTTGGDLLILSGAGTKNITNGTFQFGNASTPASQVFLINSNVSLSNFAVNATNSPTARPRTNSVTLSGGVTLNGGTYDLSTNSLNTTLGGDWTNNGGTLSQGTGVITFNSTAADQNINGTAASQTFGTLTINKSGKVLTIAGSTTSVTVTGTLTLTNGSVDLKGQTLILNSAAAAQSLAGSGSNSFTISSSTSGGIVRTTGSGAHTITVSNFGTTSSGGLIIGTNTTLQLNSNAVLNCGGNGTTTSMVTILNKLLMNSATNSNIASGTAPFYGSSSTLEYAVTYTAAQEWLAGSALTTPGVPQNVTVNGSGITLSMPSTDRRLLGDLNITLGTLTLNATSGDLFIGGNFSRSGTFTPNGRAVNFNGSAAQSISGATTFSSLIDSNTSNALTLNAITTISGNLSVTSGATLNLSTFTHSAGTLTLSGSGTPSGSWGSTSSSATNQDNTYFAATSGIINVATGSCPGISATISGTDTICNGGSSNFSVAITGGLSPYKLIYSGGGGGTVNGYTSGTNVSVSPSSTTTYTISSVTDSNRCASSNSGSSVITVNAVPVAGTLSPTGVQPAVCAGASVSATLTAGSGGAGTITDELEVSLSGGAYTAYTSGSSVSTSGQTSVSIRTRRTATGSGCTSSGYNTVSWTVNAVPSAGTLTPTGVQPAVCEGASVSATATAGSGGAGTITDELEVSLSGGTYTTYTSGSSISTTGQTSVSIRTRRTATGSGCTSSGYNTVSWVVNAVPVAGTLSPTGVQPAVCAGASVSATLTAGSGGAGTITDELEVSLSGGAYTAYTSGSSISTSGQTSVSIRTRRTATGSGCTSSGYNTVSWAVNAVPVGPVIAKSPNVASVCPGAALTITVTSPGTGGAGTSQDEYRYDDGSGFTAWSTSLPSFTAVSGTNTVESRRTSTGSGCNTASGNTVSWTVGSTKTWTGSSWSPSSPTSIDAAVISSNYSASGDISACSLTVTSSAVVTIPSGYDVTLDGALTVSSGSFTLSNNANLLQTSNAANSGNIIVKRNSSAVKRLDYTLWSSPVAGQGVYSFSPYTFDNRFYVYRTATNIFNNADVGLNVTGLDANGVNGTDTNNIQFSPAKGYLIRMPWDHPTTATVWNGQFTGVPNNGNINYTLTDAGAGNRFNLVGNPYPSPIDAAAFVTNANNTSSITGTLYFWRKTNNALSPSYCTWTMGGFVSNNEAQVYDPNDVIQTGQGFFVEGTGSGTVNFDNSMRVANHANQFFKSSNTVNSVIERNRIWLNATNSNGSFSQTMVGYITNATQGIDTGIDGRYINDGSIALASLINDVPYAIQGRQLPFVPSDVVPIYFKVAAAGNYSIFIDHFDGLFEDASQAIILKDNLLNTETNLRLGAYNFASEAGVFANRFELIYQSQLGVGDPLFTANSVILYNHEDGFVVNSGNAVMDSVKVFDISGRLLQQKNNINATQTIIGNVMANEALLIQITSQDGITVTKKAIR